MYLDDTRDLQVNEWIICHIVRLAHISIPVLALSVNPRLLNSDTQQFPDSSLCTIPYCQQALMYYPVIQSRSFDFLDEQVVMILRWPGQGVDSAARQLVSRRRVESEGQSNVCRFDILFLALKFLRLDTF